jgi:hypothetical protein
MDFDFLLLFNVFLLPLFVLLGVLVVFFVPFVSFVSFVSFVFFVIIYFGGIITLAKLSNINKHIFYSSISIILSKLSSLAKPIIQLL